MQHTGAALVLQRPPFARLPPILLGTSFTKGTVLRSIAIEAVDQVGQSLSLDCWTSTGDAVNGTSGIGLLLGPSFPSVIWTPLVLLHFRGVNSDHRLPTRSAFGLSARRFVPVVSS